MSGTVLLNDVDIASLALREYKPDGKEKSVYYVNRSESRRDSVRFQIGDTEMNKDDLPFAIMPPAAYKDTNPDKPGLMLALPSEAAQKKIAQIDEKLARLIHETCRDAIKKDASLEYIQDMQTKLVKHPKKEGGRVFLSLKLNRTGRFKTNVAKLVSTGDEEEPWAQYPATLDDIGSSTIVFALVELSPVWFRGKEWGVSLNATDLLIINPGDEQDSIRSTTGFVIYNQVVKRLAGAEDDAAGAGAGAGEVVGRDAVDGVAPPADVFDETGEPDNDATEEPESKKRKV